MRGPKEETLQREKRERRPQGDTMRGTSSGDVTRGHHEGSREGNLVRRRHGGNHWAHYEGNRLRGRHEGVIRRRPREEGNINRGSQEGTS